MDESFENIYNEQIYESITEFGVNPRAPNVQQFNEEIYESVTQFGVNPRASSVQQYNELRCDAQQQNSSNELKQGTSCYGLALPLPTQIAKRAFKSSAEKLCCTVNTMRTKFGSLSQKLRRSTRRRTQLVNSPETPVRSPREMLGRTPTKLYSPFTFDTPRGKENALARQSVNRGSFKRTPPSRMAGFSVRRKVQVENMPGPRTSPRLSKDLQVARNGMHEFRQTANLILHNYRN